MPDIQKFRTTCCIAGGGPAGVMTGYLLARAGVEVMVLEKHADFFRDFRGDTIHPSTLEVLHELGILEPFLKIPHQKLPQIGGQIGDYSFIPADFSHLPTQCKYIALMPQWDFLDFLAQNGRRYPAFQMKMNHEVTDLLWNNGRVTGVRAKTPDGIVEVTADLVIGADGRGSQVRAQSGLEVHDIGAPFDVLWLRISRSPSDPERSLGNFRKGKALVTINRQDYWQCGYLIKKGAFETIKQQGLEKFQADTGEVAPFLKDRVHELDSWDKIRLLTVQINRLTHWHLPGLLCIGDSAHAMSPVGGVGINLAIQDAVATANLLAEPLREKRLTESDLIHVQKRRELPAKLTQAAQVFVQKHFLLPALSMTNDPPPPLLARLFNIFPVLRRIPARLIGMGVRPEHVHTPEHKANLPSSS
jgi:2-polyprenyl-6-methoxyphenol hydroxylase-like FAD-dependent oxidoreductase